jgi:hypothetical protein
MQVRILPVQPNLEGEMIDIRVRVNDEKGRRPIIGQLKRMNSKTVIVKVPYKRKVVETKPKGFVQGVMQWLRRETWVDDDKYIKRSIARDLIQ